MRRHFSGIKARRSDNFFFFNRNTLKNLRYETNYDIQINKEYDTNSRSYTSWYKTCSDIQINKEDDTNSRSYTSWYKTYLNIQINKEDDTNSMSYIR